MNRCAPQRGLPAQFVLGLLILRAGLGPAAGAPAPFTNEDVVRLVMTGTAEKVILQAIDERPADFDLDPEVVEELRRAGVPERVLEAMRRRQAAMPRPGPGEPSSSAVEARGFLQVVLGAETDDDAAIAIIGLPRGMTRPPGVEVGRVIDLAVVILCTTSHHVPDHWDVRSPIEEGPRHRMIQLSAGSAPGKIKRFEVITLDLEEIAAAPIAEGRHAVVVALAGQQAGTRGWRLLASERLPVDIVAGQTTRLVVEARSRIRGSRMTGFELEQEWKVSPAAVAGS